MLRELVAAAAIEDIACEYIDQAYRREFGGPVRRTRRDDSRAGLRANVVHMTTASYQQIVELVGEVDPLFVKRIEDTGASLEEIGEALSDVESERLGAERRLVSSPRVAEVRAILDEMLDDPDEDEGGGVENTSY